MRSAGPRFYYTTNGTTPTTSSSQYISPIGVADDTTLEAIAVESGYETSAVASGKYTIKGPKPTFSPPAGKYPTAQSVTISDEISGATIYYTTDDTTPTTSSQVYTAPINVHSSETVKAIAVATEYGNSPIAAAAYKIAE